MATRKHTLYKVVFLNQGKVYELYARDVSASAIWGFTEIGGISFEPRGAGVVVDPTEERLREEFKDTRRLHLPLHAIVRIEEVERRGALAIRDAATGDKVTPLLLPR